MATKRFQFSLNTFNNCFLCLNCSKNKNFSLQSILRYLKINLSGIKSISKRPASILNKTQVQVSLCSDCEAVAERFTKHFRKLEMCKMKVESSLKDVLKLFKDELITQVGCDEKSIKHCKIANELRQQLLIKSRLKTHKIVPKVVSKKLPVLSKKDFKRESSPEFKEAEETENNLFSSVNSPCNSHLETSSADEGGAEAIKEEMEEPCSPEGNDFPDWLPEEDSLRKDSTSAEMKKGIRVKCDLCLKTFSSEFQLRRHLRNYHGTAKSGMSLLEFNKKMNIIRNPNSHCGLPFECPHCTLRFLRKDYLRKHLNRFHNELFFPRRHNCPHCRKTFDLSTELEAHLRRHVFPRPFKCPECPASYPAKGELGRHLKKHSKKSLPETKTYFLKCTVDPECPKTFTSVSELKEHAKSHEIGRALLFQKFVQALPQKTPEQTLPTGFPCKTCEKILITPLDLKVHSHKHQSREASNLTPEFKCDLCGRLLKSLPGLSAHLKTHEKNKNWDGKRAPKRDKVCSICNRTNFTKSALEDHMRTHTGERLMCEICSKQFAHRANLQKHRLTHSPSFKQIRCKICQWPFGSEESLERHRQIKHSNPNLKPSCDQCGKVFANENTRRVHLKEVHSGKKPHQCEICSKTFSRRNLLRNHQQRVHQM